MSKIHKHHIIPKHMGGSDEEDNLIELTIEEHAAAHLELYEKFGKWQDYLAYTALKGNFNTNEEAKREAIKLGRKNGKKPVRNGNYLTSQQCSKGGKITGRKNAENGHMQKIQKMGCYNGIGGKVQGKVQTKCYVCGFIGTGIAMRRWHGDRCKKAAQ